ESPRAPPRIFSAEDLMRQKFAPTIWAVEGVLPEGAYLLAGKPKQGKSWFALGLGLAIASGSKALGAIDVANGAVLYMALEDNPRRLHRRMVQILQGRPAPAGLELTTDWARVDEGGLYQIEQWLQTHPDARLVIVDTLAKMRPMSRQNGSVYGEDYA